MRFEILMEPSLRMVEKKFMSSQDLELMIQTTAALSGQDLMGQMQNSPAEEFKFAPMKTANLSRTDSHSTMSHPQRFWERTQESSRHLAQRHRHSEFADRSAEAG